MQRTKKRKAEAKRDESAFSFIADVEENPSLTLEQKINLIIESLCKVKEQDLSLQCPNWITSEKTKTLLNALDIQLSSDDILCMEEDMNDMNELENQSEFKQSIYDLVKYFKEGKLHEMSVLFKGKEQVFSQYRFEKTSDVLLLVAAIFEIDDRISACSNNGEIIITGLYNSLFNLIFKVNGHTMKGDTLKSIRFDEKSPYFNVKCHSYAFNDSDNVVFIREDKDSTECSDWEKLHTDGYKTIIISRALLRENIRSYSMLDSDLKRFSKFLGMTTNTKYINCFLLECKYDQQCNPTYQLRKSVFIPKVRKGYIFDLVSLVEFMCRYVRDYIPNQSQTALKQRSVKVGSTPMKKVSDQIPLVTTILKSTKRESPIIIHGLAIKKRLHDNVWLAQSNSILKQTSSSESYIYSVLLSASLYCQQLPSVLRYYKDCVEIERLKEIDYKNGWMEDELLTLLQDMSCALKYLHSISIMHRDVKPNNILLREGEGDYFCYVLVDFDLSCHFDSKIENGEPFLFDLHLKKAINEDYGTSIFRAPETTSKEYYSEKVDIFSLGMTALYLYDVEKMENEYNGEQNWIQFLEESLINQDLKNIIRRMIHTDPTQRPTASQLETEFDYLKKRERQKMIEK